jgi:phage shock protein C
MQPRLTRSSSDRMIAGVCGGLAKYFAVDPVLVRLIFVLVSLTSGIGILLYPVLWVLMPKSGSVGPQEEFFPQDSEEWRRRVQSFGQEAAEFGQSVEREVREALGGRGTGGGAPPAPTTYAPPPQAESFNYDPFTGQPLSRPAGPPPPPQRNRSRWGGIALVGLGIIFTAQYFGLPTEILMPIFLIIVGVTLLVRK